MSEPLQAEADGLEDWTEHERLFEVRYSFSVCVMAHSSEEAGLIAEDHVIDARERAHQNVMDTRTRPVNNAYDLIDAGWWDGLAYTASGSPWADVQTTVGDYLTCAHSIRTPAMVQAIRDRRVAWAQRNLESTAQKVLRAARVGDRRMLELALDELREVLE